MKLLREIHNEDVGLESGEDIRYLERKAVRCILQRSDKKIALIWENKGNYHTLPGGGIDDGETHSAATEREVLEEVGCGCTVGLAIGSIIEFREHNQKKQINYCYFAITQSETFTPAFTEKEINYGYELKWFSVDEILPLLKSDIPTRLSGRFANLRDRIFIEEYLRSN